MNRELVEKKRWLVPRLLDGISPKTDAERRKGIVMMLPMLAIGTAALGMMADAQWQVIALVSSYAIFVALAIRWLLKHGTWRGWPRRK